MLREYRKGDELLINYNIFADALDIKDCVSGNRYKAKTFERDGEVLCIVLFYEYILKNYAVFSIVSRDIKIGHIKELKKDISMAARKENAKTFITFSENNKVLERWHSFLGFVKIRKGLANNKVTKWVLKWELQ